jgi:hypothetical protein
MMSDRFDFEQQIQKCWVITDDIADIAEGILENNLDKDQIVNALTGVGQLYELKFNKLWELFETVHMDLVRENKMLTEECTAMIQQAGHGNKESGVDFDGFAVIKSNKVGTK